LETFQENLILVEEVCFAPFSVMKMFEFVGYTLLRTVPVQFNFNSIQFIYIVPNYNNFHLKALNMLQFKPNSIHYNHNPMKSY